MAITGVIRPPPDIRAVADKTAAFVAKNGKAFEERIKNSEKGRSAKFAFLHASSPFHAYYEQQILFCQNGGDENAQDEAQVSANRSGRNGAGDGSTHTKPDGKPKKPQRDTSQATKSVIDPVARTLLRQRSKIDEQRKRKEKDEHSESQKDDESNDTRNPSGSLASTAIEAPRSLHFVNISAPPQLTPMQIETVKLVAQFTALDNSKGFLQNLTTREWENPLFAFVQPRHPNFAYFSALTDSYKHILFHDEKAGMPTSIQGCLQEVAYRAEYDREMEEQQATTAANAGNQKPLDIDWHDFVVVETIDFDVDEVVAIPLPPPPPLLTERSKTGPATIEQDESDSMDESDDEGGDEPIRVVPNYTPKVKSTGERVQDRTMAIDPVTGKSISVADMPEHMRIQLLDPKWAEERRKFQEKQKESNLVNSDDMIASNLSRIVGNENEFDRDARKRSLGSNVTSPGTQSMQSAQPGPALPPPPNKRARLDLPPPTALTTQLGLVPPPPAALPPPPSGFSHLPPQPPMFTGQQQLPQPQPQMPPPPPPEMVELRPEEDFIKTLSSPTIQLEIQIPHDPALSTTWNFQGQTVSLSIDVKSKTKEVRDNLRSHLNGIPASRIQLKHSVHGFLNNNMTLAHYNLGPLVSQSIRNNVLPDQKVISIHSVQGNQKRFAAGP